MRKIILGPPGCGKTTRLLSIMEEEMAGGVHPNKICFVSFTRKAAYEAAERAAQRFKLKAGDLHFFRTLHSLAYRQLGIGKDAVMSRGDWKELGGMLGLEFSVFYETEEGLPMGSEKGDKLRFIDGFARARLITLREAWEEVGDETVGYHELEQFHNTYKQYRTDMGLVDYTDMLELFVKQQRALDVEVAFVDEAQDLSTLQWQMVEIVTGRAKRVYVAGDDDQAIYKWSGADVHQFLTQEGEVEVLNHSYRLPRKIYDLANSITSRISERYEKEWQPRDEEGEIVHVNSIQEVDLSAGTWLLLARNVYLLEQFKQLAHAQGVAYAVKGVPAAKKKHVEAITVWERLRAGEAVMLEEVRAVYAQMKLGSGVQRGYKGMAKASDAELYTLAELRERWGLLREDPWFDALESIPGQERAYYQAVLRRGDTLTGTPRVNISTIHGIKGGEADNVLLVPDMAWRTYRDYQAKPDDEHRVFFVAITRARQALYLPLAQARYGYDI